MSKKLTKSQRIAKVEKALDRFVPLELENEFPAKHVVFPDLDSNIIGIQLNNNKFALRFTNEEWFSTEILKDPAYLWTEQDYNEIWLALETLFCCKAITETDQDVYWAHIEGEEFQVEQLRKYAASMGFSLVNQED